MWRWELARVRRAVRTSLLCSVTLSCAGDPARSTAAPPRGEPVRAADAHHEPVSAAPSAIASLPAASAAAVLVPNDPTSASSCRFPSGFPRALNGFALGASLADAQARPIPSERGDFCLSGKPHLQASGGVIHSVAFHFLCDDESTFAGCNDFEEYVKRMGAALGVAVDSPAASLLRASPPPLDRPSPGPYIMRSADAELHIDPDVGFEAYSHIEVSLIRKVPEAICHDADGFPEFYRDFLAAVVSGQKRRVLDFFRFPFPDEVATGTYPKPSQLGWKSFPFAKFFHHAYDSERRMPSGAHCMLDYGYVDRDWMPGMMIAQRGPEGWRWSRLMYTP